jgi:hypothetical protein
MKRLCTSCEQLTRNRDRICDDCRRDDNFLRVTKRTRRQLREDEIKKALLDKDDQ